MIDEEEDGDESGDEEREEGRRRKRMRKERDSWILVFSFIEQKIVPDSRMNDQTSDHAAVMAEWLRRQTRNLMGYSRTGSNPVHSVLF